MEEEQAQAQAQAKSRWRHLRDKIDQVIEETGKPILLEVLQELGGLSTEDGYIIWSETMAWEIMRSIDERRRAGLTDTESRHLIAQELRSVVARMLLSAEEGRTQDIRRSRGPRA